MLYIDNAVYSYVFIPPSLTFMANDMDNAHEEKKTGLLQGLQLQEGA